MMGFCKYGFVLAEAKALKKFIVCTNFAGASEQIENGGNGIIVNDYKPNTIAESIMQLYSKVIKRELIAQNQPTNNSTMLIDIIKLLH